MQEDQEDFDDKNYPEDFDDNEYEEDDHDYDHPSLNPYHYFFKFDIGTNTSLSQWLSDFIKNTNWEDIGSTYNVTNIPGWPVVSLPVNSWHPNTDKGNSFQYLGSNYAGSPIWKKKYFVFDKINNEYKLHLQSHAKHFVSQPTYYNGLFDILN